MNHAMIGVIVSKSELKMFLRKEEKRSLEAR